VRIEQDNILREDLTIQHRYAVIGSEKAFRGHQHAWKAWKVFKEFGCTVYPVAAKMKQRLGPDKVYADLTELQGKIDVAAPCLPAAELADLVPAAQAAGCTHIWFQEDSWSPELQAQCEEAGIKAVRGCVLLHKVFVKPLAFFHPCYWHGWRERKIKRMR
jgi:predicted CoA-binding protein